LSVGTRRSSAGFFELTSPVGSPALAMGASMADERLSELYTQDKA
jgi:hypothetical protein